MYPSILCPDPDDARDRQCELVRDETVNYYMHDANPEVCHVLERMTESNERWHKLMNALVEARYEPWDAGMTLHDLYDEVVREIAEENASEVR